MIEGPVDRLNLNTLLRAGFVVALFLVVVRFLPEFPDLHSESWIFAVNRAAGEHLAFGKQLVFTYGPYSSVSNGQFYPGAEFTRLLGLSILALAYVSGLLCLINRRRNLLLLIFLLALAVVARDSIFYGIPVLFLVLAYRFDVERDASLRRAHPTAFVALTLALALNPLVKASYGMLTLPVFLIGCGLVWRRQRQLALLLLIVMAVSLPTLWVLSGQNLFDIVEYFQAQIPIISGYADAMMLPGRKADILVYILVSLLIIGVLVQRARQSARRVSDLALIVGLLLILFLVFKASFVRHDEHVTTAAGTILLLAATLAAIVPGWLASCLLGLAAIIWFSEDSFYLHVHVNPAKQLVRSVMSSVEGIRLLLSDGLRARYDHALQEIAKAVRLPQVTGDSDIQWRYDVLVANGIDVRQRPVPAGYSVYTPELDRLNAAEFSANEIPENVFFRPTSLDRDLPSLEDSLCWPLWLARYQIGTESSGQYLLLTKRTNGFRIPHYIPLLETEAKMGEEVKLPEPSEILWAEIHIPSHLLGALANSLFKRPGLTLTYTYPNGTRTSFRYVAGMGESGFIIRPLVLTNDDFRALYADRFATLSSEPLAKAFSIQPAPGGSPFWPRTYRIRISVLELDDHDKR
jgi:hypothetical protein